MVPANHRNKQAGKPWKVMRRWLWRQWLKILNVKSVWVQDIGAGDRRGICGLSETVGIPDNRVREQFRKPAVIVNNPTLETMAAALAQLSAGEPVQG